MIIPILCGASAVAIAAAVIRTARKKAGERRAIEAENRENVIRLFLSPLTDLRGGGQP